MRKCLVMLACLAPSAFGQQMAVDFDPAATKIAWVLAGNVHTTHGTFQLQRGHLDFEEANGKASGELVVAASSGESGNATRDKRMRDDVLEAAKYPEVRFTIGKLEGTAGLTGDGKLLVSGRLSIHGATHEVSIPMQVTLNGEEFSGKGKFIVPYVDWGMKDPSNFLFKVNKTVEIDVLAAGRVKRL